MTLIRTAGRGIILHCHLKKRSICFADLVQKKPALCPQNSLKSNLNLLRITEKQYSAAKTKPTQHR